MLLFHPGIEEVKGFAESLNTDFFWQPIPGEQGWLKVRVDYHRIQRELRRLTKQWLDCGRHVGRLLAMDPVLAREARSFRAQLVPLKDGCARLHYLTAPERTDARTPLSTAIGLFLSLLLNPYASQLVGPCPNCDKYFVQRSRRQTVYCSKECGIRHTARQVLKNRRQAEYETKLRHAKSALKQWAKAKTKKDWKTWVSERTQISKNWLTRASMKGELAIPKRTDSA